jgi:branched-chain amino acid transport system substrate-binding protein
MARKFVLLAVIGALGLAAYVVPGFGAAKTDPGITKTTITLGATYPLTGVAKLYGTIPSAAQAYYDYYFANHTINGRKVVLKVLDDAYNPSQTVQQTKKLVEQDHVFAIDGSLGTATNFATRAYLNKNKVPQVLLATGDSFWSTQYKQYPWTFGGLGTYTGEAKLMANYLNTKAKGDKVGILYQNDSYGKPYEAAVEKYLGSGDKVVSKQPFDATATSLTSQMLALKASGANVFYDIATPAPSIMALVTEAKIGWTPKVTIVNAVGASTLFMQLAAKAGASINGDITSGAGPNPADPANNNLPIIKLYKSIMKKYYPKGDTTDVNNFAGMGGAWLTIYALQRAGNPPTRAGLLNALTHLNISNDPFLYSGYKIHTTPTDRFLLPEAKVVQWKGDATGVFKPIGPLVGNLKG